MVLPKFTCNCPDYTGKQPANPTASAISNQYDRAWQGGMQSKGLYCKHIIRVIVELGLEKEWGIPNDLPFPDIPNYVGSSTSPQMQPIKRLGDDFSQGFRFQKS